MHKKKDVDFYFYILIYTIGMVWALYRDDISGFFKRWRGSAGLSICSVAVSTVAFVGLYLIGEDRVVLRGLPFFGLLTILVAIAVSQSGKHGRIYRTLDYLGRHSGNMYMVHTFLYYYWFSEFFYSLRPVLMYGVLLSGSLVISEVLECLKELIGWNRMVRAVGAVISK